MSIKHAIKSNIKKVLPSYLDGLFEVVNTYRIEKNIEAVRKKKNFPRIQQLLAKGGPIQLELGAFEPRKNWVTIDLNSEADLNLDLTDSLPFPDNSVDKIYSSHVFEHFYHTEGFNLLKECLRILKKGGSFSICVPNAAIYLQAYFQPEKFDSKKFCVYTTAFHYHSKIDYVNYMAYMYGQHRHMWDEENLLNILKGTGFEIVGLRPFDHTLDKIERDHESIYALAIK